MPGLRGPELARRVISAHPEVQVIYMSICRVTLRAFRNRHCLKTLSFCKSHFVLQPYWNGLNSFGAGPDLLELDPLQFMASGAATHA
jgi:hypothetical protein